MEQQKMSLSEFDQIPVMFRKIRFYKQRYSWDCGVACVLMVLAPDDFSHFLKNFSRICKEEGFNKSTWTIDLSYLLKKYSVKHIYCTLTLGINPQYREQAFYGKILTKDEQRVVQRFAEAEAIGLNVMKKSLNIYDLIEHIFQHGPLILLTDANLLRCDSCKLHKLGTDLQRCLRVPLPYHGHYIVVFGYSLPQEKIYYRNPSYKDRVCSTSFNALEEAWKSEGTDQDTILIFSKK